MNTRRTAMLVGALILIAYSVIASFVFESSMLVMVLEVIGGAASVAVGFLLLPILKQYNKNLTLGYLAVKTLEGLVVIVIAVLLFFMLIDRATYDLVYDYHVYIFGTGFLLLSYIFYKSRLIPRIISLWGVSGSALLILATMLNMTILGGAITFEISTMPVILNEILLAIWLIVKGFKK